MMNKKKKYLLDTSIQIKRLTSQKWRENRLDSTWDEVEPATCMYSMMEFKNSVIGALDFLMDTLKEIRNRGSHKDSVKYRLEEVIIYLNSDSVIRERDRRVRIASSYAAKICTELQTYDNPICLEDAILLLEMEAENLETEWFFIYPTKNGWRKMEVINSIECYLAHNKSPLSQGRIGYTCKKHAYECRITEFLDKEKVYNLANEIVEGTVRIRDARLRKGANAIIAEETKDGMKEGVSIGQKLCFPIGDCLIISKAKTHSMALITADKDQISMAHHLSIPCLFYDAVHAALV